MSRISVDSFCFCERVRAKQPAACGTDDAESGATKEFAIWNPIDLGYSATQIAYRLVKGETDGKPGSEINAGRMGKIKVDDKGEAAMSDPFVYNASNIDQFSKVF